MANGEHGARGQVALSRVVMGTNTEHAPAYMTPPDHAAMTVQSVAETRPSLAQNEVVQVDS